MVSSRVGMRSSPPEQRQRAQLGERARGERHVLPDHPLQRLVVEDDRHAVGAELHVELDLVDAEGSGCRGTPAPSSPATARRPPAVGDDIGQALLSCRAIFTVEYRRSGRLRP